MNARSALARTSRALLLLTALLLRPVLAAMPAATFAAEATAIYPPPLQIATFAATMPAAAAPAPAVDMAAAETPAGEATPDMLPLFLHLSGEVLLLAPGEQVALTVTKRAS